MGSFLWRGREKERVIDKLIRSNHCRDHFLITRRRTAVDLLETQTQSGHVGHILRVRRCPPGKRRRVRCLPLSLASSALSVNKSHRYVALSSLIHCRLPSHSFAHFLLLSPSLLISNTEIIHILCMTGAGVSSVGANCLSRHSLDKIVLLTPAVNQDDARTCVT